jgi:DNA-binding MarR family transcriptional regulator
MRGPRQQSNEVSPVASTVAADGIATDVDVTASAETISARDLVSRLTLAMPLVHGMIKRNLQSSGMGPYTGSKMAVMNMLKFGPLTQATLIETTRISAPTMSKLIDNMEQAGLVRRSADPNDRRRMVIEMTDEGRRAHIGMKDCLSANLALSLEKLTADERRTVADALDILHRVFVGSPFNLSVADSVAAPVAVPVVDSQVNSATTDDLSSDSLTTPRAKGAPPCA